MPPPLVVMTLLPLNESTDRGRSCPRAGRGTWRPGPRRRPRSGSRRARHRRRRWGRGRPPARRGRRPPPRGSVAARRGVVQLGRTRASGSRFQLARLGVDQHRRGAQVGDRVGRRGEREVGHQHPVARADAGQVQGQVQGGRAARQRPRRGPGPCAGPRRPRTSVEGRSGGCQPARVERGQTAARSSSVTCGGDSRMCRRAVVRLGCGHRVRVRAPRHRSNTSERSCSVISDSSRSDPATRSSKPIGSGGTDTCEISGCIGTVVDLVGAEEHLVALLAGTEPRVHDVDRAGGLRWRVGGRRRRCARARPCRAPGPRRRCRWRPPGSPAGPPRRPS